MFLGFCGKETLFPARLRTQTQCLPYLFYDYLLLSRPKNNLNGHTPPSLDEQPEALNVTLLFVTFRSKNGCPIPRLQQ